MSLHNQLLSVFSTRTANKVFNEHEYLGIAALEDIRRLFTEDKGFVGRLGRVTGLGRKGIDEMHRWATGRGLDADKAERIRSRRREQAAKKVVELREVISRAEARLVIWRSELVEWERESSI